MNCEDLIRRGDALRLCDGVWSAEIWRRIAALPAANNDADDRLSNAVSLMKSMDADYKAFSEKVLVLVEAAKAFQHDFRDLIANSEGVAGLHMNGDIADWGSLLPGGAFEAWLRSVEPFDAVLEAYEATQ